MSMYNMLFRENPNADKLMAFLGISRGEAGRFRDALVLKEDGKLKLLILTRNGGPNRPGFEKVTNEFRAHPEFLGDYDDDFDETYATYEFNVPEKYMEAVLKMEQNGQVDTQRPMKKFQELIELMQKEPNHPKVLEAMRRSQPLIAKLKAVLEDPSGSSIIEV